MSLKPEMPKELKNLLKMAENLKSGADKATVFITGQVDYDGGKIKKEFKATVSLDGCGRRHITLVFDDWVMYSSSEKYLFRFYSELRTKCVDHEIERHDDKKQAKLDSFYNIFSDNPETTNTLEV